MAQVVEFDELITFEHTKYKPVSVLVAVESRTRRFLAAEVFSIAIHGRLAKKARARYGLRRDLRKQGIKNLLKKLEPIIESTAVIKTDQSPHYPSAIRAAFPKATHLIYKGKKASHSGLGELKTGEFDPIFSINHTLAMLRANINRLFRKTWCTTKLLERLRLHVAMYAVYHNSVLINSG